MPRLTKAQRIVRAQIAADTRWAATPAAERKAAGERGQAGLRARFAREIDPNGVLPPAELAKRAENAYRVHMGRITFARLKKQRKAGDGDGT